MNFVQQADEPTGLVRALQERAARALPAAEVVRVGDWLLRHAPGCAWWVGSVLPHGEADAADLPRLVGAAESFYAARGGRTCFQVCPGACPAQLDAVLAERGYRRHTPMSLQAAPLAGIASPSADAPFRLSIAGTPGQAWWEAWRAGIHHGEGAGRDGEEGLLARVASPSAFVSASVGGETVSIARAVADIGWAGVFDVVTLPRARGRGAARTVLAAVAHWAQSQVCSGLYLQVERDNATALRLYAEAGFSEVGRYHYRERP